jgi:FkbM family methyltransferase
VKKLLARILVRVGLGLTTAKKLATLRSSQEELFVLKSSNFNSKISKYFSGEDIYRALAEIRNSRAQMHQDLIALLLLDFKPSGYFVEFGASDGIQFSNSMLLESEYGWTGILAEPGKKWHKQLKNNRNSFVETKCVWKSSGEVLVFNETEVGELSTLEMFSSSDFHGSYRISGNRYNVETISLIDLLDKYKAPVDIDYLSIDTEGSEFQILESFNFDKYKFKFISCEHNYTENRELIRSLIESKGYVRVLEDMSLFDDWFVDRSLAKSKGLI